MRHVHTARLRLAALAACALCLAAVTASLPDSALATAAPGEGVQPSPGLPADEPDDVSSQEEVSSAGEVPDPGEESGESETEPGTEPPVPEEPEGETSGDVPEGPEDPRDPDDETQTETEKVVYTYGELRDALADPVIEVIYFGDDITTDSRGAIINPGKPRLVLDGIDPGDETQTRHTLTEYGSTTQGHTMNLQSNSGLKDILVRDLIVLGGNYYGFVNIYNEAIGVTLTYQNVDYYGPQITWNRNGTAHYIDCTISIGKHGRAPDLGEVAEARYIKLEGNIHISQTDPQVNELFFIDTGAGTIEILPGADVQASTAGESGFVYCSSGSATLTVGRGARLHFTAPRRFYDGYALKGITVEEDGEMVVTITGATQADVIRVRGDLEVHQDATLMVLPLGTYGDPSHNTLTIIGGGKAAFTDPKCVALYGGVRRPLMYLELEGKLTLSAQQFNYWDLAAGPEIAGGPDDAPKYGWWKPGGGIFTLEGTASTTSAGNLTELTTNYDPDDTSLSVVPTSSTVSLVGARVLSMGRLTVTAEYLPGLITGTTEPGARVRAAYTDINGTEVLTDAVEAGDDGGYTLHIDAATADEDTAITVTASYRFLYADTIVNAAPGELALDVAALSFPTTPLSAGSDLVTRRGESWGVTVTDTRGAGSTWKLLLQLESPLAPEGGARAFGPLTNALRYGDADGTLHILTADDAILVAQHTAVEPLERHHITWPEREGPLLLVPNGAARADTAYRGAVRWTLQDTP